MRAQSHVIPDNGGGKADGSRAVTEGRRKQPGRAGEDGKRGWNG
ncbi:hypothetical protein GQ607_000163 [Colletotrichum asianum]|uniref:Uncharacterized protein n=1 Tax=Colletotrichum asianum TaxID=702518 RepID=A0A8H3WVG4_9PEZI|nr:hypothetical protein GQ607_000163 [Colletotrichum asianum]